MHILEFSTQADHWFEIFRSWFSLWIYKIQWRKHSVDILKFVYEWIECYVALYPFEAHLSF